MGTNLDFEVTKDSDSQESEETHLEVSTLASKDAHTNSEVASSVVTGLISSITQLLGGVCHGT